LDIKRDMLGDVGRDLMPAAVAPHDQPHLGGERLAQGQRRGLATAVAVVGAF
jgi:hypothetical protein